MSLVGLLPSAGFDLHGMTGTGVAMPSSRILLRLPGAVVTEAGAAMIQTERSVISVRREVSVLMAGLA